MATPETSKGLKGKTDEEASKVKPAILTINDNPLIDVGTAMESNAKTQNVTVICEEEIPTDTEDGIANSTKINVSNTDEIALSLGA